MRPVLSKMPDALPGGSTLGLIATASKTGGGAGCWPRRRAQENEAITAVPALGITTDDALGKGSVERHRDGMQKAMVRPTAGADLRSGGEYRLDHLRHGLPQRGFQTDDGGGYLAADGFHAAEHLNAGAAGGELGFAEHVVEKSAGFGDADEH